MRDRYIIVGNPNTGKTTLFNTLTKSKEKTANYSGVTVKEKIRVANINGKEIEFVDLPGIYSFSSISDDEVVTKQYIENHPNDKIIYGGSSVDIKKNMLLLNELIKQHRKVIVVVNKMGKKLDDNTLSKATNVLGVPIIQTDARKRNNELIDFLTNTMINNINRYVDIDKLLSLFPTDEKSQVVLDKFLLHPIVGKIIFFIVFALVIVVSYGKIGNGLSAFVEKYLVIGGNFVSEFLLKYNLKIIESFWASVIIGAIGTVVVYLPQLALMLSLLFILEEIGYLPRVASLFNYGFERLGMNGKSVFSLIMGVGCTTSAMLTTRNIGSKNARKQTASFLPYVGCSAKLPILILITQVILGGLGIVVVGAVYIIAFMIGIMYLKINKEPSESEYFIAEIPRLTLPSIKTAVSESIVLVLDMFKKVFFTVLISTSIMWILLNVSINFEFFSGNKSILELVSEYLAYLLYPLGLNRSDVVLSIIVGLLAKENIITAIGLFGSVNSLTVLQGLTFIIFVTLYSPCIPALRCASCEFGKKFMLKMFFLQMMVAYLSSFVFYTFARFNILLGFIMLLVFVALIIGFSKVIKYKSINNKKALSVIE